MLIADCAGDRVVHFTAVREYAGAIGTAGSDAGQFRCPTSMGFDKAGRIYIGDAGNKRIQIFAADGTCLAQWSLLPDGSHIQPAAVAVESDGALFVLNRADGEIVRLDVSVPASNPMVVASPQPSDRSLRGRPRVSSDPGRLRNVG
jgi:streptogramin lyase